jgi:hypothetical protein
MSIIANHPWHPEQSPTQQSRIFHEDDKSISERSHRMKWRICLAGSLLVIGLLVSLPISQADVEESPVQPDRETPMAVDPSRTFDGITQIDDSVVNYVYPDHITAGTPFTICFHTTVSSPDLEYMDRLDVDLPDDWTINDVAIEPKASGCPGGTEAGWEIDNIVYWQTDQTIPTGCGPWPNGEYDFCANVTAPNCSGSPWYLYWSIIGDYFGSGPHSTNGGLNPIQCEQTTGLYVSPNSYFLIGCHTLTHTLTFNLDNQTGYDDTFDIYYNVPSGRADFSGPDGIYLADGAEQDFIAELATDPCLPAGTEISATIQAAGGGMYTGAFLWMTTIRGGTCPVCYDVFLPLVLNGD